jgi:hypothetical protein
MEGRGGGKGGEGKGREGRGGKEREGRAEHTLACIARVRTNFAKFSAFTKWEDSPKGKKVGTPGFRITEIENKLLSTDCISIATKLNCP